MMKRIFLQKRGFSLLETLVAALFFTLVASGVFAVYAYQQQILERAELTLTVSEVLRTLSDSVSLSWSIEQNNIVALYQEYQYPSDLKDIIGIPQVISDQASVGKFLNSTRELKDLIGSEFFADPNNCTITITIGNYISQASLSYVDKIYMIMQNENFQWETVVQDADYTVIEGTFPVTLSLIWSPPGTSALVTENFFFTTGTYSYWLANPVPSSGVPGDLDGDGIVDGADLAILQASKDFLPGDPQYVEDADLDGDSDVDDMDETILLTKYTV